MQRQILLVLAIAISITILLPAISSADDNVDQVSYVVFETTVGDITFEVHPEWSALGAARFIELVEAGYYDGAPWFRVIDGFVAQCGIAADPALNLEWGERTFLEEPLVQGNQPGYVAFGKSADPDSRSTHIYINYVDNSLVLDRQGFLCFARVVAGMDKALGLFKCEWMAQRELLEAGGMDKFRERFPDADFIRRAYTIVSPGPAGVIEISSNVSGAAVWIDGLLVAGETPMHTAGIFPAKHRVTCRLPDGRELGGTVVVPPGKAAKIRFLFAAPTEFVLEDSMDQNQDVYDVVLETTSGEIVMEVHRDWSPLGADHFRELVEAGFYDGAPWFRVIDGFVAQCGIAADPVLNDNIGAKTIADDPVVQGNKPGFVAFGKSQMPNSRSSHIFINYRDNSSGLDPQGFSCFAKVTEGMDVALGLAKVEWNDQYGLGQPGGLEKFKKAFPQADFILKAYVRD